jgi:Cu(I)/Ag(I) efflux system periplasmic protein CusF
MSMKRATALTLAAIGLVAASVAFAGTHLVKGKVTRVDVAAQKLTIRHEAMKKFDMQDGMTMVFRVKDAAMLNQVKVGDEIRFDADKINGAFTVTEIEKSR